MLTEQIVGVNWYVAKTVKFMANYSSVSMDNQANPGGTTEDLDSVQLRAQCILIHYLLMRLNLLSLIVGFFWEIIFCKIYNYRMVDFDNSIFKKLCVVSAPSGAGKTSLIKKILKDKKYFCLYF